MFEGLLQPTHLILILAIVLIIFGPGKLSGLGKTLGSSIREFRDSIGHGESDQVAVVPVQPVHSVADTQAVAIQPTSTQPPTSGT